MFKKILLMIVLLTVTLYPQNLKQSFISLNESGVQKFLETHPDYDGRGTIVIVLDTGVDMGVDGLTTTSLGKTKVIDVQDFTGQGEVTFFEAEIDEDDGVLTFLNDDKNLSIKANNQLPFQAIDNNYFIGDVRETLWKNSGSRVRDINDNGTEDDNFYFITFKTKVEDKNVWVVFLDTDSDGDLADENPITDYKINNDFIAIKRKEALPSFSIALNVKPEKGVVQFFFDDGGHGSHCSGIATGFNINDGQYNGVAPGANVIGLKIGNNNFAGGSTVSLSMKNAYLYADKISKDYSIPCIVTMSYGIGSEYEGHADMEYFLDSLAEANPFLYICTSNGNEGPGISTTGLPAASASILSSGAILAREVGQDVYGADVGKDVILYFSSRGGEVSKPDIVSPGAAASTVPNFGRSNVMWGTSMASPYSAGVCALVLSGIKQEFPDVKVPSQLLFNAIRNSAVWIDGYNHLDQGSGYINANKAFDLLKKYIENGEIKKFESYSSSCLAPNMPNGRAPNLYLRDGSFLTGNEVYNFTVKRNNFINSAKFFRSYVLNTDADWLKLIKKKTYLRNSQPTTVNVKFDKSKMNTPGLYNAKIYATRADKSKFPEFELMATVVIPYEFTRENNYSNEFESIEVKPSEIKRLFIQVPPAATSMKISIDAAKGKYADAILYLHDPNGIRVKGYRVKTGNSKVEYYNNLTQGVYELDLRGNFRATDISTVNFKVQFNAINYVGSNIISTSQGILEVMNSYYDPSVYSLSTKLLGYEKTHDIYLAGKDKHEIKFDFNSNEASKHFTVNIDHNDFNKTTDFAVVIFDKDNKIIASTGLSYKSVSLSLKNKYKEKEEFRLVLVPAFATSVGTMNIEVIEKTKYKKPIKFASSVKGSSKFRFYPSLINDINIETTNPEGKDLPDGARYYGSVDYFSSAMNQIIYSMPIYFNY